MSALNIDQVFQDIRENTKVTEDMMIEFLLGELNTEIGSVERNKLKRRKTSFTGYRRKCFLESSDWSKSRLIDILKRNEKLTNHEEIYDTLVANAKKIYIRYTGQSYGGEDFSKLFHSIATLVWLKTPYKEMIFEREVPRSRDYIPWTAKEEELEKTLKNSRIVFVCGTAACGKRSLVEKFLNKNVYGDFVFAERLPDLQENKIQVKYQYKGEREITLDELLEQCKWRGEEDYLILTWSYYNEEDLTPLLNWSKKHAVKIIIITRMRCVPSGYKRIVIEQWENHELSQLADNIFQMKENQKGYSHFFELTGYNPFLVELFSKYIKNGKESVYSFCKTVESDGEMERLAQCKGIKIHCAYKEKNVNRSSYPLTTYLARCLRPCNEQDICSVCVLSFWLRTPIDKKFLIKMSGIEEETIEDLMAKNFIIEKGNLIQMHPVFKWAIATLEVMVEQDLEKGNETLNVIVRRTRILFDNKVIQTGQLFIDLMVGNSCCTTANIQYFYEVIGNIIYRYHRIYSMLKNQNNEQWRRMQQEWTEFLESAITSVRKMGNDKLAKWIDEKIYIMYKRKEKEEIMTKEQKEKKEWERFFFEFKENTCTKDDWDRIKKICNEKIPVSELSYLIDFYTYGEIYNIVMRFPGKYNQKKESELFSLYEKFWSISKFCGGNDAVEILYVMLWDYLKAIYDNRQYIEDARKRMQLLFLEYNTTENRELLFRAKIYNLFFELIISLKYQRLNANEMSEKFGPLLSEVEHFLELNCWTQLTTSTAIICGDFARHFVYADIGNESWKEYIQKTEFGGFSFYQKLADVCKYQYKIDDNKNDELQKVAQKANNRIQQLYEKTYTFKEIE